MFDKLVESTKQKQGGRARWLFLVTGAIYAVTLTALGIATVIGFSAALAEEYDAIICTVPPPVPLGPDPTLAQIKPNLKSASDSGFVPPETTMPPPDPVNLPNWGRQRTNPVPGGAKSLDGIGRDGISGAPREIEEPPPPPPPTPTPVVKPAATPTPMPTVSGGVLQGKGIKKIYPPYPPIARAAGASGAVAVQVTISEEGQVIEAAVISGHPLLRDAAWQAAKQWLFQPTKLSGVPVKVQGILTFNFTLN